MRTLFPHRRRTDEVPRAQRPDDDRDLIALVNEARTELQRSRAVEIARRRRRAAGSRRP